MKSIFYWYQQPPLFFPYQLLIFSILDSYYGDYERQRLTI